MNEWQKNDRQRKINIIENISKKTGLSSASIEKDWWVTMALRALFRCDCAKATTFKGGTSLSKAWSLINKRTHYRSANHRIEIRQFACRRRKFVY